MAALPVECGTGSQGRCCAGHWLWPGPQFPSFRERLGYPIWPHAAFYAGGDVAPFNLGLLAPFADGHAGHLGALVRDDRPRLLRLAIRLSSPRASLPLALLQPPLT